MGRSDLLPRTRVSAAGLYAPFPSFFLLFHLLLASDYDSLGQKDEGESPDGAPPIVSSE
jgi:hypothetical protein